MTIENELYERAASKCELCTATDNLAVFAIPASAGDSADQSILICQSCQEQIEDPQKVEVNHWRCLNDSMWSQVPAVQVVCWRMLHRLREEGWPQDLLDMLYLDDELQNWAKAGIDDNEKQATEIVHRDSNGTALTAGDAVTLIKDLTVKGANFTAKRGTTVRGISLVQDNPEHIEGRVNGQQIVILTKFVKKS